MIRGLLFDLNGTVIDILTDEGYDEIYRVLSNLLEYQGVKISPERLRRKFFDLIRRQRKESAEEFPEFDAAAIFDRILDRKGSEWTRTIPPNMRSALPAFLAETFRALSRFKLELYPDVREVLATLRPDYALAAVSDGQSLWAMPELWSVGLLEWFQPVLVSGDFGYRKPDSRLFTLALEQMEMSPDEVIFIGNDMYRDVFGAHNSGMKTIFFRSNQGDHRPCGVAPDYEITRFKELPEAVKALANP